MWSVTRLPYRFQMRVGALLGWCLHAVMTRKRHVATINVALCFPDLGPRDRRRLVRKSFLSIGKGIVETAASWWMNSDRLRPLARIEGLEHARAALGQGSGVLLVAGHFTSLDICGRLLALELPFHPVAKRAHNPLFEAVMTQKRGEHYLGVIERKDIRSLLKALRGGQACWYAPDQDLGLKGAVFAPFMGVPAATLTATARITQATQAKVLAFEFARLPQDRGYHLRLSAPLADFPSGDDVEDATRINALIADQARRYPDQYLWIHRRFKTRPDGGDIYART